MNEEQLQDGMVSEENASVLAGAFSEAPVLSHVGGRALSGSNVYSVGSISEDMLGEEERKLVDRYASEIDISNVGQIIKYGEDAQASISSFSANVLKKVRTYDLDEVGESLRDLTIELDATVEPEKRGVFGLFQKAKRGVGAIRANYSKAEMNVNRIEDDLRKHESVLMQDIMLFQQMYELNVQHYKELTIFINPSLQ